MNILLEFYFQQIYLFVLVLTRISGLVMTAPIFGSVVIPLRVRAFLAVALAAMITPMQAVHELPLPQNLMGLLVLLGREAALGLALGLAVMILFSGLQLAGQLIGQISGMSLAEVVDPSFGISVPVFAQLLDVIAMSIFLLIGGHRHVLRALLDTFRQRPPGGDDWPGGIVEALSIITGESFVVGLRAGAPVMVALLLAVLILGLISRTLPQLNVLAVGFSVNAVVLLMTLAFALGTLSWVVQQRADWAIDSVHQALIEKS
jgi:flagellar biosynthetic protein FliR